MKITARIHLVGSGRHGFDLTHPSDCHVYLVDGGSEAALIDAGSGVDVAAIVERIGATGIDTDRIRHLFVTHAHADHAGGAAGLRERLGLAVVSSPEVAAILRTGDERAASVDVGKAQGMYAPDYAYRDTPVDIEIADGERVRVGDVVVEAVTTPGHSTGHVCFRLHDGDHRDLFTGDHLLFGGRIILQDTWDCDLRAHLDSLRRLRHLGFEGLYPGHLTFSVRDGARHVRAALEAIDRGSVPPLLT